MGKRSRKAKQPKKPKYDLVNLDTQEGRFMRTTMLELVKKHHEHLRQADIALAWMVGSRPNRDGHYVLVRMKKASELDRQLSKHDFVLLVNREHWQVFTPESRTALLDRGLCFAEVSLDKNGEEQEDAHGKKLYRIRPFDIQEHAANVRRYGFWHQDAVHAAEAFKEGGQKKLPFDPKSKPEVPQPRILPAPAPAN